MKRARKRLEIGVAVVALVGMLGCSDGTPRPALTFHGVGAGSVDAIALGGSVVGVPDAGTDASADASIPLDVPQVECTQDADCLELLTPGPCEVAMCDAEGVCKLVPAVDGTTCDDGDECTGPDECFAGTCSGENACPCEVNADCAPFEDGNLCNGTLICGDDGCTVDPTTLVSCPLGDGCTSWTCLPADGDCVSQLEPDGTPCDDGDLCLGDDACQDGVCVGQTPLPGPEVGPCQQASCEPADGWVVSDLDGVPCSDGNVCTADDACVDGACVPGPNGCVCEGDEDCAPYDVDKCDPPLTCEDGQCVMAAGPWVLCDPPEDPCLDAACDPVDGLCKATPVANGTACDAGDPCAAGSVCVAGACQLVNACDDQNPCTDDLCDETKGCVNNPTEAACDDGNPCTDADQCVDGSCQGVPSCDCESDDDCTGADYDICAGTWTCQDGNCLPIPGTAVDCSPLDGPCVVGACNPATGDCVAQAEPDGEKCDDGDACTEYDVCTDGVCDGPALVCGDANICTDDLCDPEIGCVYAPNQAACDDGNACTSDDTCTGGLCIGTVVSCEPSDPCVTTTCDPVKGCAETPLADGTSCDDGNDCTEPDLCQAGVCTSTTICDCVLTTDCPDDGDLCNGVPLCLQNNCVIDATTIVTCSAGTQCADQVCNPDSGECEPVPANQGGTCQPGDPCLQTGVCDDGDCVGPPLDCSDGNECTLDTCDSDAGAGDPCQHEPLDAFPCDDGDPCTLTDACVGASCVGSDLDPCGDGNACTTDSCETGVGCAHQPVNCDDSDPCTNDGCASSTGCTYAPKCDSLAGPCENAQCNATNGACTFSDKPDGTPCDDGDPSTIDDACAGGVCTGTVVSCDDGNVCTTDIVTPFGCSYTNNDGAACDDGDGCTGNDTCAGGSCFGTAVDCEDGDPCTTDYCSGDVCHNDPIAGCGPDPQCDGASPGDPCDDGDAQTSADMCIAGQCAGFALSRHPGDPFTGERAFTVVDNSAGHWWAASVTDSLFGGGEVGALNNIDDPDAPAAQADTAGPLYRGIYGGFAVSSAGLLWQSTGAGWSTTTPLALTVPASGLGDLYSVWAAADSSLAGTTVWVVGDDGTQEYIRRCQTSGCQSHVIETAPPDWDPMYTRAVAGHQVCSGVGGCSPYLVAAVDRGNGAENFNEAFESDGGDTTPWVYGYWDDKDDPRDTLDMASFGDGQYMVVGTGGYLRHRRANGTWSFNVNVAFGQTAYTLTGVWVGAGVVVVSAIWGDNTKTFQLWVCPSAANVESAGNWNLYTLDQEGGAGAGLFDVWGVASGEIRAVGSGNGSDTMRDGLIYVRTP